MFRRQGWAAGPFRMIDRVLRPRSVRRECDWRDGRELSILILSSRNPAEALLPAGQFPQVAKALHRMKAQPKENEADLSAIAAKAHRQRLIRRCMHDERWQAQRQQSFT